MDNEGYFRYLRLVPGASKLVELWPGTFFLTVLFPV